VQPSARADACSDSPHAHCNTAFLVSNASRLQSYAPHVYSYGAAASSNGSHLRLVAPDDRHYTTRVDPD
jgi:hypothetical protein